MRLVSEAWGFHSVRNIGMPVLAFIWSLTVSVNLVDGSVMITEPEGPSEISTRTYILL